MGEDILNIPGTQWGFIKAKGSVVDRNEWPKVGGTLRPVSFSLL